MQSILRVKRTSNTHVLRNKIFPLKNSMAPSLKMKKVSTRDGAIASEWRKSALILPFNQRRHYVEEAGRGGPLVPSYAGYFKDNNFSDEQISEVVRTTTGVTFRVIPLPTGSEDVLKATELFIHTYFKSVIQSNPESSALGGEKVLLFNPSLPDSGKPDSSFLMSFDGDQDPHFHGGPRHLDMWSSKPWTVIVGGSDPKVLNDPTVQFTKIQFPAGHVSLSFAKGMLHGFSGEGIGAISTHWTDAEELAIANKNNGGAAGTKSKDLMATLTKFVDKEKIQIIGDQSIPWQAVTALQANVITEKY